MQKLQYKLVSQQYLCSQKIVKEQTMYKWLYKISKTKEEEACITNNKILTQ